MVRTRVFWSARETLLANDASTGKGTGRVVQCFAVADQTSSIGVYGGNV